MWNEGKILSQNFSKIIQLNNQDVKDMQATAVVADLHAIPYMDIWKQIQHVYFGIWIRNLMGKQ